MIDLFLSLHPAVQAVGIVVGIPLLLIFALLALLLVILLIWEIAAMLDTIHYRNCQTKIAVASVKKEKE